MSAALVGAVAAWAAIIAAAAQVFTRTSLAIFADLADGWVLTPGRRTITWIIGVVDAAGYRAHDAYHRFLRDGAWGMPGLWRVIAARIAAQLCPKGQPVVIDLDDTLLHKTGPRIEGAGIFRDAVRSTKKKVVHTLGLNLVVITVRVAPPWGGMPVGPPINMRIRRKATDQDKRNGDQRTTVTLAREMLTEIAGWLPDRRFQLACDGAYASLVGANLRRVQVTSRIRRDADVCELTPPRTGKPGRPRNRATSYPNHPSSPRPPPTGQKPPSTNAATSSSGWSGPAGCCGTTSLAPPHCCWSSSATPTGASPTTSSSPPPPPPPTPPTQPGSPNTTPAGRWTIECVFRDVKQHLGAEDPQCWKRRGPERAAALALWLHAAVWWCIPTFGARRSWTPRPWYPRKTTPSFADALAALRRTLWCNQIAAMCSATPLPAKIIHPLIDTLAQAA